MAKDVILLGEVAARGATNQGGWLRRRNCSGRERQNRTARRAVVEMPPRASNGEPIDPPPDAQDDR
jgi:hypothetical protein